MAHGLTGVDPATGRIEWEINCVKGECVSSPVAADGMVVYGDTGYGSPPNRTVGVRPGNPQKGEKPAVVYDMLRAGVEVVTPLIKDGKLYLWTDQGFAACHNLASGQQIWRERVGGQFYGSPVWVDGRLYCISKQGEVVVLAASDKYKLLARVPLGEPTFATPAVAGGVMYLRTKTQLFSLGGRKP
jgi:outer membrane protein assembly factor BamB